MVLRWQWILLPCLFLMGWIVPGHAQNLPQKHLRQARGFFARWQARASRTQARQPHWITPLATVTPLLEQEFRSDFTREARSGDATEWIYGGSKGLELIPLQRVELLLNVPPYRQYNPAEPGTGPQDGFGDFSLKMKYRLLAAGAESGNYIVTAFLGGSLPTGSAGNGSSEATLSPALAAGKGIGRWDVQTTLGATLPVANAEKLGRPISWNTALQYRLGRGVWPEVESNATWFRGGPNDGETQEFITPGIVTHVPLHGRLGLTMGIGAQIAVSQFHEYSHAIIFSGRMPF